LSSVAYGTRTITFAVDRRDRASLDITVNPDSTVTVIAPINTPDAEIATRVLRRARWIMAQQRYFAQFTPRSTPRQWLPGETHLYLGGQYRIRIGDPEQASQIHLTRGRIVVDGVAFGDSLAIEQSLSGWYRERAGVVLPIRLAGCMKRFGDLPVAPASLTVRSMTTRWASMSSAGRLSVNPALVRAPVDAIDYVLTHALAHRLEPHHGPAFWRRLEAAMPDFEVRKSRLERALA
jgi:predicted metal-dependent hydrolase